MSQVAQGPAAQHQQRLVSWAPQPSNILLGSDEQARILDFGIGSLLAENEGESWWTPCPRRTRFTSGLDCSSPESIMEPTNRTQAGDQYSFGCVLYCCLTGRYPFADGTAVEKMMAHQFKPNADPRDRGEHSGWARQACSTADAEITRIAVSQHRGRGRGDVAVHER